MKLKGKNRFFVGYIWAVWLGVLSLPFMGKEIWKLFLIVFSLVTLTPVARFLLKEANLILRRIRNKVQTFSAISFIKSKKNLIEIIIFLVALILPLFMNRYFVDVAVLCGIYIILALGLNVVVGFTGLLVLGYIAFYAVGAYAYALLWTHFRISFWLALPVGGALAGFFGVLLGSPVLRLRGDYLAIVTLGFGEIVRIILNNWDEVTRGPNGILGIGRPHLGSFVFKQPIDYYYLILIFVVFTILLMKRLENSRIGRAWVAIREDEVAASACGIDVTSMKLLAFAIGACFAGIAGVFFAGKMTFISPESFTFMESVMILCMVVLGGMGSLVGVILGAIALVILPEALREFQSYRLLVFGGAMAFMMIFRPIGLIPSQRVKLELKDVKQV